LSPSQANANNTGGTIDSQSSRPRANSKSSEAGNAAGAANFASAPANNSV